MCTGTEFSPSRSERVHVEVIILTAHTGAWTPNRLHTHDSHCRVVCFSLSWFFAEEKFKRARLGMKNNKSGLCDTEKKA